MGHLGTRNASAWLRPRHGRRRLSESDGRRGAFPLGCAPHHCAGRGELCMVGARRSPPSPCDSSPRVVRWRQVMAIARPTVQIALRNVLVATDFSPCSERAIEHALAIARHYGAAMHFAHVVQPLAYALGCPEGYASTAEALQESTELARRDVEEVARRGMAKYGIDMLDHHVWIAQGDVWEMLHALVMQEDIDLVVLGTHGRRGLRKLILGSVAEDVFRHCRCPVLTVGPNAPGTPRPGLHVKQVLFPTDLSPESTSALPFALSPMQEYGAALTVLHIAPPQADEA